MPKQVKLWLDIPLWGLLIWTGKIWKLPLIPLQENLTFILPILETTANLGRFMQSIDLKSRNMIPNITEEISNGLRKIIENKSYLSRWKPRCGIFIGRSCYKRHLSR